MAEPHSAVIIPFPGGARAAALPAGAATGGASSTVPTDLHAAAETLADALQALSDALVRQREATARWRDSLVAWSSGMQRAAGERA